MQAHKKKLFFLLSTLTASLFAMNPESNAYFVQPSPLTKRHLINVIDVQIKKIMKETEDIDQAICQIKPLLQSVSTLNESLMVNRRIVRQLWEHYMRRNDSAETVVIQKLATPGAIEYLKTLQLEKAIESDDVATIRSLIQQKVQIKAIDNPIWLAVRSKSGNAARFFIEHGISMYEPDDFGYTPLMKAVQNLSVEMAQLLLEHRANPNARTASGDNALFAMSSLFGTLLSNTAVEKMEKITSLLVAHGLRINDRDQRGQTILDKAYAYLKDNEYRSTIIEMLKKWGAQ